MTTLTSAPPSLPELTTTPLAVAAPRRGLLTLYLELTKARLSALVLVTTAVGFILGTRGEFDWPRLRPAAPARSTSCGRFAATPACIARRTGRCPQVR